jgi:hypothetical protein
LIDPPLKEMDLQRRNSMKAQRYRKTPRQIPIYWETEVAKDLSRRERTELLDLLVTLLLEALAEVEEKNDEAL